MKTKRTKRHAKLLLRLRSYGSYIDEARNLEKILAGKPASLHIELMGSGEMPPDSVLLIRSMLRGRSPQTRIVTNARSSLQGAVVLVWLLGDSRLIREDARLYFRSAEPFVTEGDPEKVWKDRNPFDEDDLEEADYGRVLQAINEFLPVKELAGHPIELPALKQFGLVDNEKTDLFLANAFRKEKPSDEKRPSNVKKPLAKEASR